MAKQKTTKTKTPLAVIASPKGIAKSKAISKKPPTVMHDGIDITIPDFLSAGEMKPLAERPLGFNPHRKTEWAAITKKEDRVAPPPTPVFVDDRALPVIVNVRGKNGPETLAHYDDMREFDLRHDRKTYPVSRSVTFEGSTIILCGAKPWAGRDAAKGSTAAPAKGTKVAKAPSGRSKGMIVADLLRRPEGCTTADVLAATGWPAVSMPAMSKQAGLNLRKEKVDKVTRYWGTK